MSMLNGSLKAIYDSSLFSVFVHVIWVARGLVSSQDDLLSRQIIRHYFLRFQGLSLPLNAIFSRPFFVRVRPIGISSSLDTVSLIWLISPSPSCITSDNVCYNQPFFKIVVKGMFQLGCACLLFDAYTDAVPKEEFYLPFM